MLLEPLGPGGNGLYRTASLDLASDTKLVQDPTPAPSNAILIVDGTFLQRAELRDCWDISVYVDTSAELSRRRGLRRDRPSLGEQVERLYRERYLPAENIYRVNFDPVLAADAVVDNNDLKSPKLSIRTDGRLATVAASIVER